MPPSELLVDITPRFQGLQSLDDLQVGDVLQFGVFRCMIVLLSYHNPFFEEVFVDCDSILFGHQHPERIKIYFTWILTQKGILPEQMRNAWERQKFSLRG